VIQQGHVALMKAIIDVGGHSTSKINIGKRLVLECQGSSIGTYSVSWLNEFYYSAQGISPEKWLAIPKAKRSKVDLPPIKILFPSLDTVEKSVMGKPVSYILVGRLLLNTNEVGQGAGTMFCRERQWNTATFPKQLFHDANSKRGGVMMHTKVSKLPPISAIRER
jgi:tyrosyl-DNA phosphodiesterase 1